MTRTLVADVTVQARGVAANNYAIVLSGADGRHAAGGHRAERERQCTQQWPDPLWWLTGGTARRRLQRLWR